VVLCSASPAEVVKKIGKKKKKAGDTHKTNATRANKEFKSGKTALSQQAQTSYQIERGNIIS